MNKFSREDVLDQVQKVQDGTISRHDSPVYQAWNELAEEWLATGTYSKAGFSGFDERTPNQILMDFHLNGGLKDDLSDDEMFKILGEQTGVGNGTE